MRQVQLIMLLNCGFFATAEKSVVEDGKVDFSVRSPFYVPVPQPAHFSNPPINIFNPHQINQDCYGRNVYGCVLPQVPFRHVDPFLDAYLLSSSVGLHQPSLPGFNHLDHLPLNPYLALLLSHYGKYIPIYGTGRGLYGYAAANNYHNNKPFGAYKISDDHY